MSNVEAWVARLRQRVRQQGVARRSDLEEVEQALAQQPASMSLWVLRGDLIQLGEDDPRYSLQDALASYQRAATLDPRDPAPPLEIGHFLDAVMDDPAGAIPFFERAIELGAGAEATAALESSRSRSRSLEGEGTEPDSSS